MIQSNSQVSLNSSVNPSAQKAQCPGEKKGREPSIKELLLMDLALKGFLCCSGFDVPVSKIFALIGVLAAVATIDYHKEPISKGLKDLGSTAKSAGTWIGDRIDHVLLGRSQEEAAVKVEDVKSQIFNK